MESEWLLELEHFRSKPFAGSLGCKAIPPRLSSLSRSIPCKLKGVHADETIATRNLVVFNNIGMGQEGTMKTLGRDLLELIASFLDYRLFDTLLEVVRWDSDYHRVYRILSNLLSTMVFPEKWRGHDNCKQFHQLNVKMLTKAGRSNLVKQIDGNPGPISLFHRCYSLEWRDGCLCYTVYKQLPREFRSHVTELEIVHTNIDYAPLRNLKVLTQCANERELYHPLDKLPNLRMVQVDGRGFKPLRCLNFKLGSNIETIEFIGVSPLFSNSEFPELKQMRFVDLQRPPQFSAFTTVESFPSLNSLHWYCPALEPDLVLRLVGDVITSLETDQAVRVSLPNLNSLKLISWMSPVSFPPRVVQHWESDFPLTLTSLHVECDLPKWFLLPPMVVEFSLVGTFWPSLLDSCADLHSLILRCDKGNGKCKYLPGGNTGHNLNFSAMTKLRNLVVEGFYLQRITILAPMDKLSLSHCGLESAVVPHLVRELDISLNYFKELPVDKFNANIRVLKALPNPLSLKGWMRYLEMESPSLEIL